MIAPAALVRQRFGELTPRTLIYHTLVIAFAFVMLYPILWMIASSFKPADKVFSTVTSLIPRHPTLDAYRRLFAQTPFVKYLRNSTIIAVTTTVGSLVLGSLGAYALARLRFPGRSVIARGLIFTYLVPQSLLFIPLFAIMSTFALIDTREGLVLAYLGITLPFCTWLLLGYFRSVPLELEEAALVDGCSRLATLVRIILPMSLPALAVVAFFSFTQAWNEFIYANVLVNSVDVRTITTGLTLFIVEDVFFWGPMMAASVMATIPPVLVYLAFQRWVVKGLTLGAVKG